MPADEQDVERRSRRAPVMAMCIAGALLLIAVVIWPLLPGKETGGPNEGKSLGHMGLPTQTGAQSGVGREGAGEEDQSGGRARAIKHSNEPLNLSADARQRIARVIQHDDPPVTPNGQLEPMIGTAVPRQVRLKPLPAPVADELKGYQGAQYTVTNNKLLVVDAGAGRVVAIVPDMGIQ